MQLEELSDSAINYIFANVDEDQLTEWESDFYPSVKERWEQEHYLTPAQKLALGRLWERQK